MLAKTTARNLYKHALVVVVIVIFIDAVTINKHVCVCLMSHQ